MKIFSSRETVGTSPAVIFQCKVSDLQTVEIYAVGAIYIGDSGVTTSNGNPLAAGESITFDHLSFRKDQKDVQEEVIKIYAVAAAGTSAQVSGWRR